MRSMVCGVAAIVLAGLIFASDTVGRPAQGPDSAPVAVGAGYERVTLPGLKQPYHSHAYDINDDGLIVGQSEASFSAVAVIWRNEKKSIMIVDGPPYPTTATGINNSGVAVGSSDGKISWWWWRGRHHDIGSLGGTAFANDINDHGWIVGGSDVTTQDGSERHAFLWTPLDGMKNLGTLGGREAWARAINNRGEVVGRSERADGSSSAFYWSPSGGMIDLATELGCTAFAGPCADAWDINNLGQVVGEYRAGTVENRAFIWSLSEGKTDIPVSNATAFAINDAGGVIGVRSGPGVLPTLWVWNEAAGVRDIDVICDPPCSWSTPFSINLDGDIVGARRPRMPGLPSEVATLWRRPR
jgi:probable HAF family extracellular repeat protein